MGKTLQIAEEFRGYTLTDMGTYLKYRKEGLVSLEVLVEAGKDLINVYSAIAVNPENNSESNFEDSLVFIEFLISDECQSIFRSYGVDEYGTALFLPAVELLKTGADPVTAGWIEDAAYFDGSECPDRFRTGKTKIFD